MAGAVFGHNSQIHNKNLKTFGIVLRRHKPLQGHELPPVAKRILEDCVKEILKTNVEHPSAKEKRFTQKKVFLEFAKSLESEIRGVVPLEDVANIGKLSALLANHINIHHQERETLSVQNMHFRQEEIKLAKSLSPETAKYLDGLLAKLERGFLDGLYNAMRLETASEISAKFAKGRKIESYLATYTLARNLDIRIFHDLHHSAQDLMIMLKAARSK